METFRTARCLDLRIPTDPQIAPGGDRIAYVRRQADPEQDRWVSHVCVAPVDGGEGIDLGRGTEPRWRPDGEVLAFVVKEEGGFAIRLWTVGACGSETTVLCALDESPQGLSWSPDGSRLAFVSLVPASPPEPPGQSGGWATLRTAAWASPPVVTESLVRRVDGLSDELRPGHHHVFVLDVLTGHRRQLTHGPWNHGGPLAKVTKLQMAGHISWTPDGRHIVMSMQRDEAADDGRATSPLACGVYEFDVESGAVQRLAAFDGPACQATVSPDGRWIAFVGFRDTGKAFHTNKMHLLPREGGTARVLAHPQGMEVHSSFRWAPDSQSLFGLMPWKGTGRLFRVDLGGRWGVLASDVGGSLGTGYVLADRGLSVSRTGSVAYLSGHAARTDEVAVATGGWASVRRVTRESACLDSLALGRVEEVELKGTRTLLQGWLLRPHRQPGRHAPPLILWLHGGPYAAWGHDFAIAPQAWAARGYAVLMINPRGSVGYGEASTDALQHDFPGPDDLELLAGVEATVQRCGLDASRVFVAGESGGAVLASWLIGHSHRFMAAALLFGVADWASHALTADRSDYFANYWFPGPPLDPDLREHYWRRSPLSRVRHVRTPTLLMCGDQDWRTPLSQSEAYYTALKLCGCEARLARFPGACHGLDARPSEQMSAIDLVADWFDRAQAGSNAGAASGARRS